MHKGLMTVIMLSLISCSAFALDAGISGRSKGDVIAVKTDSQIAAWCDFNKQIVMAQFNTLCVYNGNGQQVS